MLHVNELSRRHVSLKLSSDVKEICDAFFRNKILKISHLNYIQKNVNGTVYYLCSNHDWLLHYYLNSYPSIGAFENIDALSDKKYVIWNCLGSDDRIINDSKDIIGVEHGITIIEKNLNGTAFFNLGCRNSNPLIISEYVSNLDLLNEFTNYFKEKAHSLISIAASNAIILFQENNVENSIIPNKNNLLISKKHLYEKKLYIDDSHTSHLSHREIECIDWYLRGKTSTEIAEILGISKRTVETHIEHVKEKLKCRNMTQIGYQVALIKYKYFRYIPRL